MKKIIFKVLFISVFFLIRFANANGCAENSIGQVICAPPGGGAAANAIGQVVTGPGECIMDSIGRVMCSSQSGGGAALDSLGRVVCADGCVEGKA